MDQALLVEVTTYGFLHAGQAPLRREVLKRSWPFLPGSTLFGALQAGLIRLDGPQGKGPHDLLTALCAQEPALRFTPLLPDPLRAIHDAASYCNQAGRLADQESGVAWQRAASDSKATGKQSQATLLHYQTTPHAPLNRRDARIEGSLLFAIESHAPEQRYRGWIFCKQGDLEQVLRRAMGLLPFLPLGGKGKFTAAEARVVDVMETASLQAGLERALSGRDSEVELVSPMAFQGSDDPLLRSASVFRPRPLRRYRVWRTGDYPSQAEGGVKTYGNKLENDAADLPLAWNATGTYLAGQVAQSVMAFPEGSGFTLPAAESRQVAEAFVSGVGLKDWAVLGWGQIFVRGMNASGQEVGHD